MAGLFDLFGGGGTDASGLYGGLLDDQQKQALAQRGLLGFLGGMQKSGALDYTAPFLSGKVPGGFAAGLAGGAGGMGEAQDAAGLNALRGNLLGLQGQQLKANLAMLQQEGGIAQHLFNGGQAPTGTAGPNTAAPGAAMPAGGSGAMSPAQIKQLALDTGFQGDSADKATAIVMAESGGNPNAVGDGGDSFGLSQINKPTWGPIAASAKGNAPQAMKLMFDISKGGQDFSPWSTYKNGAYQKFMGASAVQPIGAGLLPPPPPASAAQPGAAAPPQAMPPAASPAPTGLVSPPGGINPQAAQALAFLRSARGAAVPDFLNQAAGMPFVGPKAAAEAGATNQSKLDFAPKMLPYEIAKEQAGPAMRGEQNRQTAAFEMSNKPIFVEGVGWVQPKSLPGFSVGQTGAATSPNAGAAAAPADASAAASPGAQPSVLAAVMSPAQKAVLASNLDSAKQEIKGYHAEGQSAVEQVANASAISDLLGRVRMGWNANTIQNGARILSSLGASNDTVKQFLGTDPSAGDALNKLFLKFSADAVRQMGAREPGSVISLFSKAYPNLETMPHAAELMTNALRMQAQWKQDRANAAEQYDVAQQTGMGQFGQNYRGMLGFEKQFSASNNPRDYWRAAAAMSNEPEIAWGSKPTPEDAHRIYALIPPGQSYRAADGKLYMKPAQ